MPSRLTLFGFGDTHFYEENQWILVQDNDDES